MPTSSALPPLPAFRAFVAEMRKLGVLEASGIRLGPVPRLPEEEPRRMTLEEQEAERGDSTRKTLRLLGINASEDAVERLRGRI